METQSQDVIISGVELTTWGMKIKNENGAVFNVPQYKKGTTEETVAYKVLKSLPNNGMNLKKTLTFVTVQNGQGGNSRYVRNITDISGQPNVISKGEQFTRQQIAQVKTKSEDEKWNEISKGKVRHGVACEFIRLGAEYNLETINKINKWTEFIMTGQMFNKVEEIKDNSKWEPSHNQDLETIQIDEVVIEGYEDPNELKAENIPF